MCHLSDSQNKAIIFQLKNIKHCGWVTHIVSNFSFERFSRMQKKKI